MASIRTRKRADGTTSYHVLWREKSGKQTSLTFPTERQAENFRRLLTANDHDLNATLAVVKAVERDSPLLAQVLAEHVEGIAGVTARTREDYRRIGTRYLVPHFGAMHVDTITAQHVRDWINHLADGELADKTIANAHGLLSAVLTTAVERGYRPDNPSKGVRLPRRSSHSRAEMVFLTPDEWHAIDAELTYAGGKYRTLFRTLAGTGARWGEVTALKAGDLQPGEPAMLRIERAVKRGPDSKLYIGPTKTKRGERTVSLDGGLADELIERARGMKRGDLLFAAPEGGLQTSSRLYELAWRPAVERSGVEKRPRIHDLRHTHASWLLAGGVDLLTVSRRLGHETISTTADVYSHLLPGQQKSAADAIGAVMGR